MGSAIDLTPRPHSSQRPEPEEFDGERRRHNWSYWSGPT